LIDLTFGEPSPLLKEIMAAASWADERSIEYGLEQAATRAKWPAEKDFWAVLSKGALTRQQRETMRIGLSHFL